MKRGKSQGAYIVEFAIVAVVFLTILLGIIDFARLLFLWNTANEATLFGARAAVVCKQNSTYVNTRVQSILNVQNSNINVQWYPDSCNTSNCTAASVEITGVSFQPISPFGWIGFSSISMPTFKTYMTREMMGLDSSVPEADCAGS